MRILAAMFTLPLWLGAGQTTTSSGNGWSRMDAVRGADAVVVGEIVEGRAVDGGSSVEVTAALLVARTVKGKVVPQTRLRLAWQYAPSPGETPEVTGRVVKARALWFLKDLGDGQWLP